MEGSRPRRQARRGVTYKESEDDDEGFVSKAKWTIAVGVDRRSSLRSSVPEGEDLGIAKGKRTLTLKRARNVEPRVAVGQEVANAYAILDEENRGVSPDHGRQLGHVVDAAQGMRNLHKDSSAFECLLEAVSGISGDGEDECASVGRRVSSPKTAGQSERTKEQEESSLSNSSVGKGVMDKLQIEGDTKCEQDRISSADEKKYSRRSDRDKQKNLASADGKNVSEKVEEERQESGPCVYETKDSRVVEEKPDDVACADEDEEDDGEDSWNDASDASDGSDAENKRPVEGHSNIPAAAKLIGQEVKKTNVIRKDLGSAGRVLVPAKSTSVSPLLPKKRPAVWVGSKPFVPPGPVNEHSPIVAHRRVVGLSRRHRPPPLHPYLLGS